MSLYFTGGRQQTVRAVERPTRQMTAWQLLQVRLPLKLLAEKALSNEASTPGRNLLHSRQTLGE